MYKCSLPLIDILFFCTIQSVTFIKERIIQDWATALTVDSVQIFIKEKRGMYIIYDNKNNGRHPGRNSKGISKE